MTEVTFKEDLKYVYNLAFKMTLNRTESEDLAQETMMVAWEKESSLKSKDARKGWLKKICMNLFYMEARKKKSYTEFSIDTHENEEFKLQLEDKNPLPEAELIAREEIVRIRDLCFLGMTQELTLNQRSVFMSVDVFGLSLEDAGDVLGISGAAAKAHLHRGRKRLNHFFSQKCRWFNPGSICQCEAYLEFQGDLLSKKQCIKPSPEMVSLDSIDEEIPVSEEVRAKIKAVYANLPTFHPGNEWFKNVSDMLNKLINPKEENNIAIC